MKLITALLGLHLSCAVLPPAVAAGVTLAERDALTAATTAAAHAQLKLPAGTLRLVPEQLRHEGNWAFLTARVQTPAGARFDYAGTELHEAAQAGAVSDLCAALLRREGVQWRVVDIAVGPTDVAWEGWAATHHAPPAVFP
ncbi:MAG: hypothetical protein Q4G71_11910 [Pseudomonadota bacterium]|nr:hypothetical protein [Pseudomonadota bacterium]